jgi:hypothetical protein
MSVFCSPGGANSAGQTRETYDPTYCSVKLPEPQPLAPMDAETVERYVGASNYWALSSSLSSSFMYFSTVVGHFCSSLHTALTLIFASRLFLFSLFALLPTHSLYFAFQDVFISCLNFSLDIAFHLSIFILICAIICLKIILDSSHIILSSVHSCHAWQESDICSLQFV